MIPAYKRILLIYVFPAVELLCIAGSLALAFAIRDSSIPYRICTSIFIVLILSQRFLFARWAKCPHCGYSLVNDNIFSTNRIVMCPHCSRQVEVQ